MNKSVSDTELKSWWCGNKDVEPFMSPVQQAISRHIESGAARTDIYNRAYEAVYNALNTRPQPSNEHITLGELVQVKHGDQVYVIIQKEQTINKQCMNSVDFTDHRFNWDW